MPFFVLEKKKDSSQATVKKSTHDSRPIKSLLFIKRKERKKVVGRSECEARVGRMSMRHMSRTKSFPDECNRP